MFLRRRKIRIEIEQTTLRLETQRTGEVAKATESAAPSSLLYRLLSRSSKAPSTPASIKGELL